MAFRNTFSWIFESKSNVLLGLEYRPHYALSLLLSADEAKSIGVNRLKVFELGCAGGSGLVDLQFLTKKVKACNARLPRTIGFFNYILFTSDYSGELPVIKKFDASSDSRKISKIPHLASLLPLKWRKWIYLGEKIFSVHFFDHVQYSVKSNANNNRQRLDLS